MNMCIPALWISKPSKATSTSNRLGVRIRVNSGGGLTRDVHHLHLLGELASSHPERESPAMAQATDEWLRVEKVIP